MPTEKIGTGTGALESPLNPIWYEVGELPHDFAGRDSESAAVHTRLSDFHSNRSVDANIVCISGPAGCGKSTLARKYAFDNYSFYDSNVIWVEARSVEEMRVSFKGLAAELKLSAESDTRMLVTSVYKFFNRQKCLFVFDGLERMEDFAQFKPKIMGPRLQTPYLLITSRSSELAPNARNELCIGHYKSEDTADEAFAAMAQLSVQEPPREWNNAEAAVRMTALYREQLRARRVRDRKKSEIKRLASARSLPSDAGSATVLQAAPQSTRMPVPVTLASSSNSSNSDHPPRPHLPKESFTRSSCIAPISPPSLQPQPAAVNANHSEDAEAAAYILEHPAKFEEIHSGSGWLSERYPQEVNMLMVGDHEIQ